MTIVIIAAHHEACVVTNDLCLVVCHMSQIAYRSVEANELDPMASQALKLSADSWGDLMEAFPIVSLAFMGHFNMLSVRARTVSVHDLGSPG